MICTRVYNEVFQPDMASYSLCPTSVTLWAISGQVLRKKASLACRLEVAVSFNSELLKRTELHSSLEANSPSGAWLITNRHSWRRTTQHTEIGDRYNSHHLRNSCSN